MSVAMLLGLAHQLMRFITDLVVVRTCSDAQLRAEVLALQHQLRVLERKVGKPAWLSADRILLAGLSRLLAKSGLPVASKRIRIVLRCDVRLVDQPMRRPLRTIPLLGQPSALRGRRRSA